MPHLVSEAYDYNDLIWQTRALALNFPLPVVGDSQDPTSLPEVIDNTIGGASVGDGRVYIAALSSRAVLEEITLTCTVGGADGVAQFSVSGVTTGAFDTATLTAGERFVSNDVLIIIRTIVNWSSAGNADRIKFTLGIGGFTNKYQESQACTFANAGNTITRDDTQNWTDHFYVAPGGILVADAVDAANNAFHVVDSIAADELTISVDTTIADEAADTVTIIPYQARDSFTVTVDFDSATDEIFLTGLTDGWNSHHIQEGDYIKVENAASGSNDGISKVLRVYTSGGGTNRDTIELESGGVGANASADLISITVFFIPERWCEDRFRGGNVEVLMGTPPTEDGNGDFVTTWEFHGMGISGTEALYGSWNTVFNAAQPYFNVSMRAADSFLRSNTHGTHPNSSLYPVYLLLNRSAMQFYLSVNGDALWGFARSSGSVDQPFYHGTINRHGSILQLPYPMTCAGASGSVIGVIQSSSSLNNVHTAWWDSYLGSGGGGLPDYQSTQLWFQTKDGSWSPGGNGPDSDNNYGGENPNAMTTTPYVTSIQATALTPGPNEVGWRALISRMRSGFGNVYELIPIELHSQEPNHYGEFHGMYHISGQGDGSTASEDYKAINGVRHVAMQNTFRTTRISYAMMRLEP